MICVRSLRHALLFSEVWHSLLVAEGPTKFGTVCQTAKEYHTVCMYVQYNNTVDHRKKMAVVATGTKILYVPLYYFLHTTRLPFVGAKPKQSLTCFLADSVHHGSRQRLQTLSLWRGDDPASTQSSSTHHGRLRMRLVWSKSVGGTNSCYRYNHRVNGGFFMRALSANCSACGMATTFLSAQLSS